MEIHQILVLLYLIALIILMLIEPRWALLFFFSTKFTIDLFWDYTVIEGFNILKITGVLFPLGCLAYYFMKRPPVSRHPFWKVLLTLFSLNVAASLWGVINSQFDILPLPHTPLTIKHVLDWNFRFLNMAGAVLIVPYILKNPKDHIAFFRAFLISTIVPCLISWIQLGSTSINLMITNIGEPYSVSLFQRLNASYHDPGTLAMVMFTAITVSIFLLLSEPSKLLRVMYKIYTVLCSVVLYFTFSRTLWIGITLFLILFFFIQKEYKVLFATVAIALLILTLIPLTQKRFERELSWIENGESMPHRKELEKLGTGRIWLWDDARKHYLKLDIVSEILGSGGSFGSHNQYIAWLLRNGIIGLTVWLLFLYKVGKFTWLRIQEEKNNRISVFVFVLFWIVTCMMNVFMQPWDNITFSYFFWGSIGLFLFQNDLTQKAS